jgi:polysaccharide pyruvyl transferase WcaK-like protein
MGIMRKATVFYLWGRKNAGDMAICLGTIFLLQELGYEITFVSRFTNNQLDYRISKDYIEEYHHNIKVKPGLFSFDRTNSTINQIVSYLKGIIKLLSPIDDKRIKKILFDSDVVFLNGGNLLRGKSFSDYARLAALFYPFRIANNLNKTVIGLPQSTANTSNIGYRVLQHNLKKFNTVFIRESKSYLSLQDNLSNIPIKRSIDLAFFIKDNPIAIEKFDRKYRAIINTGEKNIALVLRSTTLGDIGEFSNFKKENIKRTIKNFVEEFKKGYNIFFVIQTKKDIKFTNIVVEQIPDHGFIKIIEEYDPYILREVYKKMEFVVAMRLHAAILSMTANTPVLGYFDDDWGYKNPGIMDDVGMLWTMDGAELVELGRQMVLRREDFINKIRYFIDKEKETLFHEILI